MKCCLLHALDSGCRECTQASFWWRTATSCAVAPPLFFRTAAITANHALADNSLPWTRSNRASVFLLPWKDRFFRDLQIEREDQLPMGSGSSTTANSSDMKDVKEFIDKENSSHQVSNALFRNRFCNPLRFFHQKKSAWSEWAGFNRISFNALYAENSRPILLIAYWLACPLWNFMLLNLISHLCHLRYVSCSLESY